MLCFIWRKMMTSWTILSGSSFNVNTESTSPVADLSFFEFTFYAQERKHTNYLCFAVDCEFTTLAPDNMHELSSRPGGHAYQIYRGLQESHLVHQQRPLPSAPETARFYRAKAWTAWCGWLQPRSDLKCKHSLCRPENKIKCICTVEYLNQP